MKLQIRWGHVAAFVVGMLGIWADALYKQLATGQSLSLTLLVGSLTGSGMLVWALFQETVWPDLTGGSGTASKLPGGSGGPSAPGGPPSARRMALDRGVHFVFSLSLILLAALSATPLLTGCQQIQAIFPQLDKVEQIVLAGVLAGEGAEQIEKDVAAFLAGKAGVDIVVVVNDAIGILIDMGIIPAGVIPQMPSVSYAAHAASIRDTERAKLKAKGVTP